MRPKTVGALSALGMFLTSVTVYSVTPNGGFGEAALPPDASVATLTAQPGLGSSDVVDASHFVVEEAVRVDGRLGHAAIARGDRRETFVLLELSGAKDAPATQVAGSSHLSIVLDQSGSMRGTRLANAKQAALRAIDGLRDGDTVSVVAFDTRSRVVVPSTRLDGASRRIVSGAVQAIALGGDTCISCGVDAAMAEIARSGAAPGAGRRILLLSDGDANNGVRDVVGFRDLGRRSLDAGVEITTVGVSLEYNELFLGAIAETSNGRHYFVENDAGLARVFEEEARFATGTVASDIVVEIDLAPGVELSRVFDRTFSRSGSRLRIPVGPLARGEQKTVLLQVALPGGEPGDAQPVATTRVERRDPSTGATLSVERSLAARLVSDAAAASPLDGVVAARLQRTETASILEEANELARRGQLTEARGKLAAARSSADLNARKAKTSAPASRRDGVAFDFDDQLQVLEKAEKELAAAAPAAEPVAPVTGGARPAPPKKPAPPLAAPKRNVEAANAYKR